MLFRLVNVLVIVQGCAGAGSPALEWKSAQGQNERVQAGLEVIKRLKSEGVIDAFMEKYPEFKAILWGEPHDAPATLALAINHAKKLCLDTDLDSYMANKGFVSKASVYKKNSMWTKGSQKLFAKAAHYTGHPSPNNGFLRAFYQDVFKKLHEFNPRYGWNNGLTDCLYQGNQLVMVGLYSPDVDVAAASPRPWVLPQLHYMGVLPIDLHHGNFGMVKGEPAAVPVDLDAVWRGQLSSFMKMNPSADNIYKMQHNYHSIDHILAFAATEEPNNGVFSPTVIWSAALGGFLGSAFVIAMVEFKKKAHSESSKPLLA